jgi:hypothetical protein
MLGCDPSGMRNSPAEAKNGRALLLEPTRNLLNRQSGERYEGHVEDAVEVVKSLPDVSKVSKSCGLACVIFE